MMFYKNIIKKFTEIAAKYPHCNAFCIDDTFYTYGYFWDLICKQRTLIRNLGLTDSKIGLVVNDDLHTYASIFAIWLEGMGYVPLHPKFPIARNLDIVKQAELQKVLDSFKESEFDSALVVKTNECISLNPTTTIPDIKDDSLAYILFTSGSTGEPKGVQISFKNLNSFVDAFLDIGFNLDNTDRCLQCFDLTFDVSVQCFLVPLIHGSCVYTVPHEQIKYSYVFGLLDDHELTFGIFAPSMIRMLKPYFDEIVIEKLRYSIFTAEASPVDLIKEWAECIPNSRIFNFYGPTEATIYCTYYEFIRNSFIKEGNGMIAIGKPFKGVKAVMLDDNLNIINNNAKGEMYVSSDQVTEGYWKNPELNKEAFIDLDYGGMCQKFYKTGDLCKFDDDNDILYYGRLDNQVKIQGYRIELGEIEFHAREAMNGQNAIAFIFKVESGSDEIALCIETQSLDENIIKATLKTKLPSYMIPSRIYHLEKFPLNTSDKVDKKKIMGLFV